MVNISVNPEYILFFLENVSKRRLDESWPAIKGRHLVELLFFRASSIMGEASVEAIEVTLMNWQMACEPRGSGGLETRP